LIRGSMLFPAAEAEAFRAALLFRFIFEVILLCNASVQCTKKGD
jgi:hypothetical protein